MIDLKTLFEDNMLISEGGAQGHLGHVFEDPDLTFKELKDLFTKLFKGKIAIHEKLDGQALAVTYRDGEVKAARNKATLKNPMSISEVGKLFDGKGEVKNAFVNSMKDISKALKSLSKEELDEIFDNGHKYMAFEIIYPPTKNVIDYGNRCMLVLHGVNVYDDNWNRVSEDKAAADKLYELLKKNNALKQDMFEISGPVALKLKDTKVGEESLKEVLADLAKLADGLGWNATINDYAKERFEKYIINRAMDADFPISKRSDFVSELADRLSKLSKRHPTKADLATFAKREGIDIKSEQYNDFIKSIDSTIDDANAIVIKPLEDLVIKAGIMLMKNLSGFMSADPKKSSKKLATELDAAIKDLSDEAASLDASKIHRFKKNLAKLDQWQREILPAEGIVFSYKGKIGKITSTFAPINQILGILKYK